MQWTDMPSKGGKGKGSKIDQKSKKKALPQQPQSLPAMYEGAMDNSNFFECLQKNSQKWMKVRVIGAKLIQHEYPFTESSYEYYIHYENENRRWDEWVTLEKLKPTDERIPDEPKRQQQKAKANDFNEYDEHEGFDQEALNLHLEHTKFKTIKQVKIGKYLMDTWYYSAFPLNYQNVDILYFCDFCLSFYKHESELLRHKKICLLHTPPGNEIYRDDSQETSISMFEVDGRKSTVYVENLSYFSKLFLDHKNLFWNMETFLFYVLCENDSEGSHVVGYFSKEKESKDNYNLSCILVFPIHQRKGYGKFLITFSFELSAIEDKIGTPERPLSDLGRKSYLAWWSQRIIQYLESKPESYVLTVEDITKNTYIKDKDVLWTLEQKGIVKYSGATSMICTDSSFLKKLYKDAGSPGVPVFRQNIHWVPFRSSLSKDCVSKQPEYDPLTGSNYTHVFLKNIVGLAQTAQVGGQKHKKTPSKKNTQKQLTSTLQATPTSHNQNSNSLPINNHAINNNSNNGNTNNSIQVPSGNNMNNHMMGNHNPNYAYGNNISNDMNPMNSQEHQFGGHLYPAQVQSSLQ